MGRRSTAAAPVAAGDFTALIAERAYFKAEQRGFAPGHELEDWLAAEGELGSAATAPAGAPARKQRKPAARRKNGAAKKVE